MKKKTQNKKQSAENPNKQLFTLLIILFFASELLAVETLGAQLFPTSVKLSNQIYLTNEESQPAVSALAHGLTFEEYLEKNDEASELIDSLPTVEQTATQPIDDCKPLMNDADFEALADLERDITCTGTTAPTVKLTGDIALSPDRSFRLYLGGIDSDYVTTHNVDFDCQGHSITHSGYTFTLYYSSILRNCTIIGPSRGVWAINTSQVINTTVKNATETGFFVNENAQVSNSTALADQTSGGLQSGFRARGDAHIINSAVTTAPNKSPYNWGFELEDATVATNITSTNNNYGVRATDKVVINGARAIHNSGDGFWLAPGVARPGSFGWASTCNNCIAENNGGHGFFAYGRLGSEFDQAITQINGSLAKGNAWNGYTIFDGVRVTNSSAQNNGTNINDLPGAFWPEEFAHFGFRLDQYDNPQSYGQLINVTGNTNKNGAMIQSAFSLQGGTLCNNQGKDIIITTGGSVSGLVKSDSIQNTDGTFTATRSSCAGSTGPSKPPKIFQP